MKRVLVTAALLLGLAAPVGAWAQRGNDEDNPKAPAAAPQQAAPRPAAPQAAAAAQSRVPLDTIIADVSRRAPGGELLTATPGQSGATPIYQVKWKTADGRRIDFIYNAQTGRLISQEGG